MKAKPKVELKLVERKGRTDGFFEVTTDGRRQFFLYSEMKKMDKEIAEKMKRLL